MSGSVAHIAVRTLAATLGIAMLGTGVIGYLRAPTRLWERVTLLAGAVLLIFPGTLSGLAGVACFVAVWVTQSRRATQPVGSPPRAV